MTAFLFPPAMTLVNEWVSSLRFQPVGNHGHLAGSGAPGCVVAVCGRSGC